MWDDINPFYAEKVLKQELAKNEEKNNKPVDNKRNMRLAFFIIDMPIVICAFAGLIIYGILSGHLVVAWVFIPVLFVSVIGIILFTFLKRDKKKTNPQPVANKAQKPDAPKDHPQVEASQITTTTPVLETHPEQVKTNETEKTAAI